MVGQDLRQELIDAGGRMLRVADEAAIRPAAAAWLRDHRLGEWRYYLATALVDQLGRRIISSALAKEFAKIEPPEDFTFVDVYLASPIDPVFYTLTKLFQVPGERRA